jgi:hypothetical protein
MSKEASILTDKIKEAESLSAQLKATINFTERFGFCPSLIKSQILIPSGRDSDLNIKYRTKVFLTDGTSTILSVDIRKLGLSLRSS